MVHFGGRHSRNWHEKVYEIHAAANTAQFGLPLVSPSGILNPEFPWDQLNHHTDSYLKKKGKITPGERDNRLQNLIKKHGALDMSVAACARFMSPEAIRSLLADELKNATSHFSDLLPYLQATVAAHHQNPLAITEADSQLAQTLIWCSVSSWQFTSQKLENLVKKLIVGISSDSFAYPHVVRLVQEYSAELSRKVKVLKDSHRWLEARAETEWLLGILPQSILDCTSGYYEAKKNLDQGFPAWQVWAEWKPCDTELARALLQFPPSGLGSRSESLKYLVKMQMAINPRTSSYVYFHVREIMQKTSSDLAGQVASLKKAGLMLAAHEETGWLSTLLDPSNSTSSGAIECIEILEGEFPDWRAWAEWGEQDSQLAQALIPCHTPDPSFLGQYLTTLIEFLLAGIPIPSLLHSHVQNLARKFTRDIATKLEALKLDGQWSRAHKESECLSMLLNPSSEMSLAYGDVVRLLEEEFASWRAWAEWRPNPHRLQMQERLTAQQRRSLLDLLALEGPDFAHSKQATMREGLLARYSYCPVPKIRWGSVEMNVETEIANNARDMLERLSNAVAAACARYLDSFLLKNLCCNSKPIDDNVLKILEGNNSMGNVRITSDVLNVLEERRVIQELQMAALLRLLSVLGDLNGQVLREALAPYLVECISTNMRRMQAMLKIQLGSSELMMPLHRFGKGVQAAQWLLPLLDVPLRTLILSWPSSKKIKDMNSLRSDVWKATFPKVTSLTLQIHNYYTECLIEAGTMDQQAKDIVESLINLWHQKLFGADKRAVALMIAQGGEGFSIRRDCLRQLPTLPDGFVHDLRQILEKPTEEQCRSCVNLARLFATSLFPVHKDVACWRSVLYHWLIDQDSTLFEYTLTELTINEWFQWIADLQPLFWNMIGKEQQIVPKVLRPELHDWAIRIKPYSTTIQKVERILGSGSIRQCFRAGFESAYAEDMLKLLHFLDFNDELSGWDDGGNLKLAVWSSTAFLERDGCNSMELRQAVDWLFEATAYGTDVYLRIIEIYHESSPEVAQALLVGWLQNPDLTQADKEALKRLGGVMGFCLNSGNYLDVKASAANKYIIDEMAALRAEVQRLSGLRRSLKIKDPEGTSALCAELGFDDTSPLGDEIASLPHELLNLIEMVDDDVFEMHFPLTHHTALQRAGMGTGSAQSLIVRLVVGISSLSAGFCIHLDNELRGLAESSGHSPWLVLDKNSDPGAPLCQGQINRATYQLGHFLSRHLRLGPKPLEETYKMVKLSLDNMSEVCIICGLPHGIRLRRSGLCQNSTCSALYLEANLNIQFSELREDTQVADLLLTAVQAAVFSNNMALLPCWPGKKLKTITEILSNLPSITTLPASKDLHAALEHSDEFPLIFLKWMFGQYGGYLVSATGIVPATCQMRIPSMPGAYQFLLANAAPHLEKAFALKMGGPTTVVFHGTSMDRLYAILCQGLQVLSGTPLQKTGAARGNGIYVAEEPRTSWGYASTYICTARAGWNSGTFDNFRVLLACEASGIVPGGGFHVVTDPSALILRYIFLIPPSMRAPLAAHIVPAMASVFASLRSGAL